MKTNEIVITRTAVESSNIKSVGYIVSWEPGKTALAMTEDGP